MLYQFFQLQSQHIQTPDQFDLVSQTLQHLSILTPVIVSFGDEINVNDIPKDILNTNIISMDGFSIVNDGAVASFLDSGLSLAFFKFQPEYESQSEENLFQLNISSFPRSRIGLTFYLSNDSSVQDFGHFVTKYRNLYGNFHLRAIDRISDLTAFSGQIKSILNTVDHSIELYVSLSNDQAYSVDEMTRLATFHDHLTVICPSRLNLNESQTQDLLYIDYSLTPYKAGDIDIIDLFISCLKTDREDGLYTTVVCDEHNACLGLVYSNKESIRRAILEKKGIYWSRSRNSLWRKGDTSGMGQDLLQVRYDCDRDAIRMKVIQKGNPPAFCHLLSRNCWGHEQGLGKLQRMLEERKASAPEGSYTKRLFNDEDLLRKKLLEEVQELVEAREKDHIAAEAADVMYFLMTRCVSAGVKLADIEKHLDLRSYKITRRPGNAKDWRTSDAEKILGTEKMSGQNS